MCQIKPLDFDLILLRNYLPDLIVENATEFLGQDQTYHYVYLTIDKTNNRFYIGKHSTYDLDDGYLGSGVYLWRAIDSHGIENFINIKLKFFMLESEAYEYEDSLITNEMIKSEECYNIQGGGSSRAFPRGDRHHVHQKVAQGIHPFQHIKPEDQYTTKLAKEGKHWWNTRADGSSVSKDRVDNGTHHFLGTKPWNLPSATLKSKLGWWLAPEIYQIYKNNPGIGISRKFAQVCTEQLDTLKLYNLVLSRYTLESIVWKYDSEGFDHLTCQEWIDFKNSYNPKL